MITVDLRSKTLKIDRVNEHLEIKHHHRNSCWLHAIKKLIPNELLTVIYSKTKTQTFRRES
jgi:hypothetical protein